MHSDYIDMWTNNYILPYNNSYTAKLVDVN